jgi:hypothetical protein
MNVGHNRRFKDLMNGVNNAIKPADRHLLEVGRQFTIPNFMEEREMLQWAGIDFGEKDTFKL